MSGIVYVCVGSAMSIPMSISFWCLRSDKLAERFQY